MAQERLGEAELLVCLGARRELHLVALRRKRLEGGATGRGGGNWRRGQEEGSTRCASAQFSLGRRTGRLQATPLRTRAPRNRHGHGRPGGREPAGGSGGGLLGGQARDAVLNLAFDL